MHKNIYARRAVDFSLKTVLATAFAGALALAAPGVGVAQSQATQQSSKGQQTQIHPQAREIARAQAGVPSVHRSAAECAGAVERQSTGPEGRYLPVTMKRIAEQAEKDPAKIWSDSELSNPNTPYKTDIWEGTHELCSGVRVVISQIMNRQCSSHSACPVRIIAYDPRRQEEDQRVVTLLNYKQMCPLYETFMIRKDGQQWLACNQPYNWRNDDLFKDR